MDRRDGGHEVLSSGQAVKRVRALLATAPGPGWVAVDGFGASGKTTFAATLVAAVPGAQLVHLDDFARPGTPGWRRDLFVEALLSPLLAGQPARYRTWDLVADVPTGWAEVQPGRPVVVEGVSVTDQRVPVPWDVVVWVHAERELRHARARRRDGEALWPTWRDEWIPSEDAWARSQRPRERADLVVDGGAAG